MELYTISLANLDKKLKYRQNTGLYFNFLCRWMKTDNYLNTYKLLEKK